MITDHSATPFFARLVQIDHKILDFVLDKTALPVMARASFHTSATWLKVMVILLSGRCRFCDI